MDEQELLRTYADGADQEAFGQLVRQHGAWLFSAARRQLGDEHLAEDVTQAVFLLLARRAKRLNRYAYLGGWLFGALRYCAKEAVRQRARRERREREAATMRPETIQAEANWEEIAPLLESVVGRLGKADRDAVLLRFYEQKPLAEVGRLMGVSEEAARKRVDRAVEKLRGLLKKQGVTGTSAGLSAVLLGNVVQEVPARVVEGVMSALRGGGGGAAAGGIAQGAAKMMVHSKVKVAAGIAMLGLLAAGVVVLATGLPSATAPAASAASAAPSAPTPESGGAAAPAAQADQGVSVTVETRCLVLNPKLIPADIATRITQAANQGQVNYLDDEQVYRLLRICQQDPNASVTAGPQIAVFDGGEANADASTTYPYRGLKATKGPDGSQQYTPTQEETWEGLRIKVGAKVTPDRKYVRVNFRFTQQRLKAMEERETASARPGDPPLRYQAPTTETQEIETTVVLPDGGSCPMRFMVRPDRTMVVLVKPLIHVRQPTSQPAFPLL